MEFYQYLLLGVLMILSNRISCIISKKCKEEIIEYKKSINILKIMAFLITLVTGALYLANKETELFVGALISLAFLLGLK